MKPELTSPRLKRTPARAAFGPPEEERKAYLDQACGDDPELPPRAELILAQGAEDSAILQEAGDVPESALQPGDEHPPSPRRSASTRHQAGHRLGRHGRGLRGAAGEAPSAPWRSR